MQVLIGVTGEGPDELCNLLQFTLKDDTLYALDGGCPKLVAYNLQGDICAKYPLPLESKLKIGYHFLVNGVTKFGIPPVLLFYQAHLLFLRVCPAHTFFDG